MGAGKTSVGRRLAELVSAPFVDSDAEIVVAAGMTIPEIAALRGSAEGTIKSHLNAVYRKSGTQGRGDLLAVILDDLIEARPKRADGAAGA